VVEELLAAIAELEAAARRQHQADREREARRQRESKRNARQSWGYSQQNSRQAAGRSPAAGPDRQRAEALIVLELSHGASLAAVKAAQRRLVKCHHPDMGGDAEAFRRINAAYQLLIA
jgi:hypothetical protein